MSVFENLLVAAMFGGRMNEQAAGSFCAEVLDQCGLMAKANVLAGELSLLDRKRLELARALASRPKLLLLDEIAGGLTDEEADKLVQLVLDIKRQGATVVWIEHVLRAVMAVADRVMVLNFGAKLTEGTPQAVMADKDVQRVYMGIEA
jgi:branched-chain amino acid transport system ATP-binding protein